jgi:hypothetical protein
MREELFVEILKPKLDDKKFKNITVKKQVGLPFSTELY